MRSRRASTTAAVTASQLESAGLESGRREGGSLTLLATDGARRFARVGARFLGTPVDASDVEIVDL